MDKPDPHIFGPSDVAKYTGVPVDMQRDWRRRDVLPSEDMPGFCIRQSNGRWRFTFNGLFWVYSISRFAKNRFDLFSAAAFASEVISASNEIMEYQIKGGQGTPLGFKRYLAIFPADSSEEPIQFGNTTLRSWDRRLILGLEDLPPDGPDFLHLVDILSFSETWLRNLELTEDKARKVAELVNAENFGSEDDGT